MWARLRLDIGWADIFYGMVQSVIGVKRDAWQTRVEAVWSPRGACLSTLSVRTGFDLLLGVLDFPPRSEILITALTVRDMVGIIEHHGLVAVPIDLNCLDLAPDPKHLRSAITPACRAIVVAQYFGGRNSLEPIARIAKEKGILLIEDAAQAYTADSYRGSPHADVSLFSFGPIKTASALGGAMAMVRSPGVLARMRERQAAYPEQSRWAYLRRLMKYAVLKALSCRFAYGRVVGVCRLFGVDYDGRINAAVKGFAGADFFDQIRRQPCAALLAVMARRLGRPNAARMAVRRENGTMLMERLQPPLMCPGGRAADHTFWVFPVWTSDSAATIGKLRRLGFDATQGDSMVVVDSPAGRSELRAAGVERIRAGWVFVPCYAEMPPGEILRLAEALSTRSD
ncbi:MAG: hypothetical protein A3G34_03965 [Candidatus Lindowbacteria bacterium RIFCSPLOWO2_12_FULL_62_27]|nr:MAG: hypothetical protein A3G34_03965 [Candidatus Lindowbacteria bacterium RIFCSPLOWO2_12_FULL_62_27]OGH63612.1 MAG: hypothetical protein A3I06_14115 [Candidatus Lindowbacteria bacterium RIFCSPLOWO2_02_FULL_62_12]